MVAAESLYFDKWLGFGGVIAGPSTFSAGVAVTGSYTDPFAVIAVFAFLAVVSFLFIRRS